MTQTETFAPTAEQATAVELFETGESLAIEAGAGTGKTSTLVLLGRSTRRRGQYVAFNRAIVEESKTKMPANVACNTAHALAMRAVGHQYAHRLKTPRMKSADIAARLRIEPLALTTQDGEYKRLTAGRLAGLVMRTLSAFCQTADPAPTESHVPYVNGIDIPPGALANNLLVRAHIMPAVRAAWKDAQATDGTLPFGHDRYLKIWQLSGPKIGADFILFDEAQDANPVMRAIVEAQSHAQRVYVGDSQQQIYSFTGAVNALANVDADHRTFLTQSFRFGPAIAEVANRVLASLHAELRVSGYEPIESRVTELDEPDVVLCRTNATAVRNVLLAIGDGRKPHLVGGGREVVDFAKAAIDLKTKGWTSHPDLVCFDSWAEVQNYVEQDEQGGDLRLMVSLVDEFGTDTILNALDGMTNERLADVIVSTAHKAKGREWGSVKLAADFPEDPEDEELRLLYVAVTRAKNALDVSNVRWLVDRLPAAVFSGPLPAAETQDVVQAVQTTARPETAAGSVGTDASDAPLDAFEALDEIRRLAASRDGVNNDAILRQIQTIAAGVLR